MVVAVIEGAPGYLYYIFKRTTPGFGCLANALWLKEHPLIARRADSSSISFSFAEDIPSVATHLFNDQPNLSVLRFRFDKLQEKGLVTWQDGKLCLGVSADLQLRDMQSARPVFKWRMEDDWQKAFGRQRYSMSWLGPEWRISEPWAPR